MRTTVFGRIPADFTTLVNHEPSAWLRSTLGTLDSGLRSGRVAIDPHLRRGDVGLVGLWRRDEVFCHGCAPAELALEHGSTEDRRCDRCGAVRATVRPYVLNIESLLVVMFGLCDRCHRREAGR